MFDRSDYTHAYAPSAAKLEMEWNANVPTPDELERFILGPLCETTEDDYFLAISDLLLDVVKRQSMQDQVETLAFLWSRLLDAALCSTTRPQELQVHFWDTIVGFADLYRIRSDFGNKTNKTTASEEVSSVRVGCLVMFALLTNDLAMARMIGHAVEPICCTNAACSLYEKVIKCPECALEISAYSFHRESL